MVTLKQKATKGFFWSAIDAIAGQGIIFVATIILGRLLSPNEFGLIGLTITFVAIVQVIIDGGLGLALIRKQDCTNKDYSTVFWFNAALGIIAYSTFYFSSPFIAAFFNENELSAVLKISGICLIVGSLTSVQQAILTKNIDFKSMSIISSIAAIISSGVAIYSAFNGKGVWALVYRVILNQFIKSLLLWIHNKWIPSLYFSKNIFYQLFRFGYKLSLTQFASTVFKNIYNAIIGKSFNMAEVGYYSTADQYASVSAWSINTVVSKVTYPVFSTLQDNQDHLKAVVKQMIGTIMFIMLHVMLGITLVAKPLLITLMTEKWAPAAIYLQALCFAYTISPMQSINQNVLTVLGRSDLLLKAEMVRYLIFIPIIILGIFYGITVLLIGYVVYCWLGFFINAWFTSKLLNYSIIEQMKDFFPSFVIAGCAALFAFVVSPWLTPTSYASQIVYTLSSFLIISTILSLIIKPLAYKEFLIIVNNLKEKIK